MLYFSEKAKKKIDFQSLLSWYPSSWKTRTYLSYSQYHGCWWPGDMRSQSISSHGIDLVCWDYSGFSTKRFNSLTPGRSEYDSKYVIFNLVLLIGIFRSSHDNALQWMPQDLTDDKSTLVQVMAWCRQATSHFLSQCWLSSLSPYGVARPQWVNEWYEMAIDTYYICKQACKIVITVICVMQMDVKKVIVHFVM